MSPFNQFAELARGHAPKLAVVLGSGLGSVPNRFTEVAAISFAEVPGLVSPSVPGHFGKISLGLVANRPILLLCGRLHYYEGHAWDRVAEPVRIVSRLGIPNLLLTNAAGGIHAELGPGDLMLLCGHLFFQRRDRCDRYPVRTAYSNQLRTIILNFEATRGRRLLEGVYAAVTGPSYETPAEIRAFQQMGADAVGMSTAFEAETAASMNIQVAAISCVTNKAAGLVPGNLNHAEVLANASKPADRISEIVEILAQALG